MHAVDSSPSPSLRAQTVWGRGGESARQSPSASRHMEISGDAPVCIHNQGACELQ